MITFMKHSNTPLNNSIAMELKYNMLKHLPYQYFNPKERCKNEQISPFSISKLLQFSSSKNFNQISSADTMHTSHWI